MASYVMDFQAPNRPKHFQYTITATAVPLSDSTILNTRVVPKKITVKNADGAANIVYLGPSTVTATPTFAGVELGAGDSFTYENQAPGEIYVIGTAAAANILFVEAEW